MKKITLILSLALFLGSKLIAQTTALPIDATTKLVTYTEVVDVKGAQMDEMYKRANAWFLGNYKNPSSVFRKQDPANGEIKGVHSFKIYRTDKKGAKADAGDVVYTITIFCKNEKYKYEITKLNQKTASYFGIERWLDKNDKAYKPEMDTFVPQVDTFAKGLIENIKKAMQKPSAPAKKNDW